MGSDREMEIIEGGMKEEERIEEREWRRSDGE